MYDLAEGEGFEPPMPCGTPVFKTGAINHSAIPPAQAKRLFTRAGRIIPKSTQSEKSLHTGNDICYNTVNHQRKALTQDVEQKLF